MRGGIDLTRELIHIENLTKTYCVDEITVNAFTRRVHDYRPRQLCRDHGSIRCREIDVHAYPRLSG